MTTLRAGDEKSRTWSDESGQAIVEFAISVVMLAVFLFGVIDFTRAIYQQQELTSLAAQGANLALRGTDLQVAADTVAAQSSNLGLSTQGKIFVSAVQNQNNTMKITDQRTSGSATATSKVGVSGGTANIPTSAIPPVLSQTVYVTEIYMTYQPITPIGKFVSFVLPTQLYDVAYY
jgi:Flp pilus assembly protein TadG